MGTSVKTGASAPDPTGGVAGQIVKEVVNNKQIQQQLFSALIGFLTGLLSKKAKPPVVLPGDKPQPNPNATDPDFPDDVIPAPLPPTPEAKRVVTKVVAKLIRAQYSRGLNPEMYGDPTPDNPDRNPQGLYKNPRRFEGGGDALNIGAKGWIDATAFDQFGREFLPDAVAAYNLAYATEHHVGAAYIKGNGGKLGDPNPGYETNDTEQVGNGISAWISSNGFLHQVKFHAEGKHDVYVVVGGVESNHFDVRVD